MDGWRDLDALGRMLDLVDGAAGGGGRVGLGELILSLGAVDALLEDGVDLVHVELGLEVSDVGVARGVGTTARVGKVELVIDDLVTRIAPMEEYVSECFQRDEEPRRGGMFQSVFVTVTQTCTVESQTGQDDQDALSLDISWDECMSGMGFKRHIPVGLTTTTLLDLLGILASMAVLGEEAREMFLWGGSAVSQTGVVLVVVLKRPLVRPERLGDTLDSQPQRRTMHQPCGNESLWYHVSHPM